MEKFINRKTELKFLNDRWNSNNPEFIVIYGKRRVGKTELIKEFIKDKNSIYFLSDRSTEKENLKNLGRIAGRKFGSSIVAENGFDSWYQFFNFLRETSKERIIVAIDEFPYLYSANKAVSSIFQKGWDEILEGLPIFLILCGSSISMMLKETLIYSAPLYGRRTGQIFLKPMGFYDSWSFFNDMRFDDFLKIYAVCGGIPLYIKQFNDKLSFNENLNKIFFSPNSLLFNEGELLVSEELSEVRIYFTILKALAMGKTKFGEIINYTGLEKTSIHKYLYVLKELQLIEKEVPVTEKRIEKSRKGLYKIKDPFFKFWFAYIFPFKSEIEIGNLSVLKESLRSDFNLLISNMYEIVCREILVSKIKNVFLYQKVGRWWDKNEEIDIVATNEEENKILFGEVKWSNKKVGLNIIDNLKKKTRLVEWGGLDRKEYFILFSKSGFTDRLIDLAKSDKSIFLVKKDRLQKTSKDTIKKCT